VRDSGSAPPLHPEVPEGVEMEGGEGDPEDVDDDNNNDNDNNDNGDLESGEQPPEDELEYQY
jgi:hypothetical protein